jgi:hypothetical protein
MIGMSNFKEWITTIFGFVFMSFAVGGYYFQWPISESVYLASAQFIMGFLLLFADRYKLGEWVQKLIEKRLNG